MSKPRTFASFRDPSGRVFQIENRIIRAVEQKAWTELAPLLEGPVLRKATEEGCWIASKRLSDQDSHAISNAIGGLDVASILLEHPRVNFPTFPYEWIPEMLYDAASLILQLSRDIMKEGGQLKDATPFNVLFRGARPVWIDVTSVLARNPLDPTWQAYGQFHRTLLLPLLVLQKQLLSPSQIFLSNREGLEPENAATLAGPWRKLTSPWFGLATMPTWLGGSARKRGTELYQTKLLKDPNQAEFVLDRVFRTLQKQLNAVHPYIDSSSVWSDYVQSTHDSNYYERREEVVNRVLQSMKPRQLLDVGANTGRYSIAAAKHGAEVVSLDLDSGALAKLYARAKSENLNILPVLANLANPSPGTGWCNQECAPLIERLRDRFDGVLMLAVLHHLLVTERVPMQEIVDLTAALTREWLLIEFILPHDDLFRQIARGRDSLYDHLTLEHFETCFNESFTIGERVETMPGRRWLYLLRKRKC